MMVDVCESVCERVCDCVCVSMLNFEKASNHRRYDIFQKNGVVISLRNTEALNSWHKYSQNPA